MGYCPFSVCAESRYSRLYRDTARLGMAGRQRAGARHVMAQHATIRPLLGHHIVRRPAIQPGASATRLAMRAAGSRVAIQRFISWLRGGRPCIVAERRPAIWHSVPCDTTQERCDTRDNAGHDARAWPWCWVCHDTACDTADHKPRYGRAQAHDTAVTWPAWAQCAQAG